MQMSNMWLNTLQMLGLAWWIEVKTDDCTYFFGPFENRSAAAAAQTGYVEDLEKEGASNIQVSLMKGKPNQLTVDGEKSTNPALV